MINQYMDEIRQRQGDDSRSSLEDDLVIDTYEGLQHPDPLDPVRLREKNLHEQGAVFVNSGEPAPFTGLYQTESPSTQEVEMQAGETLPDNDGSGQLWRLNEQFVERFDR